MRDLRLCLLLLSATPLAMAAQANTAELLYRAIQLHGDLDVERELPILRQIIAPNSPFEVSREQRVLAYKYLGAALAVAGRSDSAVIYFRAAIERDPFTDLDAQKFTPRELAAFAEAKRQTFALGVQPIATDTVNPRSEGTTFIVLSTHRAALRVDVRPAGGTGGVRLFEGQNDGPREIPWNGVLAEGRLAPPGTYELVVTGQSGITQRQDSVRAYFTIVHDHPPLEDSLPAFRPGDLLPEQYPPGSARTELAKGFGLGAAAILVPTVLANNQLEGGGKTLSVGVAGAVTVAGVVGFLHRQHDRDIPANVEANARRRAERAAANAEIQRRNRDRLALTKLVLTAGVGTAP